MTRPLRGEPEIAASLKPFAEWDGTTYYGRQQLKPWPMEPPVVGAYILLAGLSGSSQILATVAAATGRRELDGAVRRGRYLSLLAPTIGSALLVYDLHTPKRFYNMLRVAKATSPMSIGTWVLMGFSGFATVAAAGQAGADRWPKRRWMRGVATAAGVPAAVLGSGLCTYTAALLSATSTPVWASAPATLAVRFASSSIATGSAALALGERDPAVRAGLDAVQAVALAAEWAVAATVKRHHERAGVEGAYDSPSGKVETYVATGLGVVVPLALLAASGLMEKRPRALSVAAGLLTLVGSAALRTSMLEPRQRFGASPRRVVQVLAADEPARAVAGLTAQPRAADHSAGMGIAGGRRGGGLRDLVGPDAELLQPARPEGVGERHVGGVAAEGHQHAALAGGVVARIEHVPAPAEIDLHPGREIAGAEGRLQADVADVARAVAGGDVHGAAEGDGEMREIAADAAPFGIGPGGGAQVAGVLVVEPDVVVHEVHDGLHAVPAGLGVSEQAPRLVRQGVALAVAAGEQEAERVGRAAPRRDAAPRPCRRRPTRPSRGSRCRPSRRSARPAPSPACTSCRNRRGSLRAAPRARW